MAVKFDESKRIDLRANVINEARSMTHNVNYALPVEPNGEMKKKLERYYSGKHDYIGVDKVDFFADAQRIRNNVLSEAVIKNMVKNFDVNKFSRPIDIVKFRNNGKTYNVCVDGQGRCAFALYMGIKRLRYNVLFETDCWSEVCSIPMSINDKKNYQKILNGQKFEMLLMQGNKEVTDCYEFLKSKYDRVYLPSEVSESKKGYQNNVFGCGQDWSNYLWFFQFYDNTCKIENDYSINPNTAVTAYQFIEEKINDGHWYLNWMRTFNAIYKAIKEVNKTHSLNMKFEELFDKSANKVDYNKWSRSSDDRKNFSIFIDNSKKYDAKQLAVALISFCDHNNLLNHEYTKRGFMRKKWLNYIIDNLNSK